MKKHTIKAFHWVVGLLKDHKIWFVVYGGMDARLYGSRRKLVDIDIAIPRKDFHKIIKEIGPYIRFGPRVYKDKHWRAYIVTIVYKKQIIDLCSLSDERIFDHSKSRWILLNIPKSATTKRLAYGINVPVMKKSILVRYKEALMRGVDRKDLGYLVKNRLLQES